MVPPQKDNPIPAIGKGTSTEAMVLQKYSCSFFLFFSSLVLINSPEGASSNSGLKHLL